MNMLRDLPQRLPRGRGSSEMSARTTAKLNELVRACPDGVLTHEDRERFASQWGLSPGRVKQLAIMAGLAVKRPPREYQTAASTQAIIAEMQRRWPCERAPLGALAKMALEYGVSRQRISQIARRAGVAGTRTKEVPDRVDQTCPGCGEPFTILRSYYQSRGRDLPTHCRRCRENIRFTCPECGGEFWRNLSQVIYTANKLKVGPFCSNPCFGAYAGRNYGFRRQQPSKSRAR